MGIERLERVSIIGVPRKQVGLIETASSVDFFLPKMEEI